MAADKEPGGGGRGNGNGRGPEEGELVPKEAQAKPRAEEAAAGEPRDLHLADAVIEAGQPENTAPALAEAEDREAELPLDLSATLRSKEQELSELQDKYLRLAADYDNAKKRWLKERSELLKYAHEHFARALLDAIDNLERAVAHADGSDKDSLVEGISLVDQMFLHILEKFGIRRFSAVGQPFDPAYHEAVQEVASDDVPAGVVVYELHKGYRYHDRLLRPARVVLSRGPAEAPTTAAAPGGGGPPDEREGQGG